MFFRGYLVRPGATSTRLQGDNLGDFYFKDIKLNFYHFSKYNILNILNGEWWSLFYISTLVYVGVLSTL